LYKRKGGAKNDRQSLQHVIQEKKQKIIKSTKNGDNHFSIHRKQVKHDQEENKMTSKEKRK
jgi:hypothetical protein